MEVDKSILLQKQVRDNSSDLQSEYFDMKNWEEQMKRKDCELLNAAGDQLNLPPIRSKKKSTSKKLEEKLNKESNAKRIKSSDYESWDKFDVDKACQELEDKDERETSDEDMSKEELEEKHNEALGHKEKGNLFVKEQQWKNAVRSYNEAIKIFPYDAVFYANRALCHLKMDNLHSAEADCTAAIQLDENYVKAYHRRATVRKELKHYKEAANDLEKVLRLDSTNKEASKLLADVKKKLEASKPLILTEADIKDDTPIEKKIGEKLCGGSVKKLTTNKIEKSLVNEIQKIPRWNFGEGEDVAIVEPIVKPPHQRSKKPLKRIEVKEKEFGKTGNETSFIETIKPLINETVSSIPDQKTRQSESEPAFYEIGELPPVPRTTVQFFMNWKKNKNPEFRYEYLKQIPADTIHKIFKDSMEPDTFSEMLSILSNEFIKKKEPLYRYLEDLAQVKRFGALTMFMTAADKKALNAIFEYCETFENKPKEVLASMRKKYEI